MKRLTQSPLIALLAIAASFCGCWISAKGSLQVRRFPPDPPVIASPLFTSIWNEQARLLAGLPLSSDSPYFKLSFSPSFQKQARLMESFWRQYKEGYLDLISEWGRTHIPTGLETRPVLYTMSGTDFPNAYELFPHAREYLFIALEPPGYIPDLFKMTELERKLGLYATLRVAHALAVGNYMQSSVLREQLTNKQIPGALPMFLIFCARLGHTVQSVDAVEIDEDGNLHELPGMVRDISQLATGTGPNKRVYGVRIKIRDNADGVDKSIVYLQLRLSNESVHSNSPEGKFLQSLRSFNTILKAAVYILHQEAYRDVREFILDRSDLVLQDDSGIPYGSFAKRAWNERLFGSYTRILPIGGLPNPPQQPLLARRFREIGEPLHFPYGYGVLWGKGKSNLMLFVRRTAPAGMTGMH